jgi:hypothetical protein
MQIFFFFFFLFFTFVPDGSVSSNSFNSLCFFTIGTVGDDSSLKGDEVKVEKAAEAWSCFLFTEEEEEVFGVQGGGDRGMNAVKGDNVSTRGSAIIYEP